MRAVVITVKDSPNYGGILQSYALQKALEKIGVENDLIDYINPEFKKKFTFFGKPKGMTILYWLFKKVQFPLMLYMQRKMFSFYNYMNLTDKYSDCRELRLLNGRYDAFITGSDQVWACDLIHYDASYLLGFVNGAKKISYAASLGRTVETISDQEKHFLKKYLQSFDAISLREKTSIPIVESMVHKCVEVSLDPVFLLSKDEWRKAAEQRCEKPKRKFKRSKRGYVLCYLMQSMRNDKEALTFAKKLAAKRNLGIVKICRGLTSVLWGETIFVPTVEEWLDLFLHAEYIVTNSFHGTAFSINFNRDFTVFVEGDITKGRNSRMTGICRMTGLESRIKKVGSDEKIDVRRIQWETVNEIIQRYKSQSIVYLRSALGV